jgi:hypothetical protein
VAAAACTPAVRYPGPGEPGPVVTAGGDTIPEGPGRDAFMAGFDAGLDRARSTSAPDLGYTEAWVGGAVVGFMTPLLGVGRPPPAAYYITAGGLGLIGLSRLAGVTPPLVQLPASVIDQGPHYQAGYREGYDRGRQAILRPHRWRGAATGAGVGLGLGLLALWSLIQG